MDTLLQQLGQLAAETTFAALPAQVSASVPQRVLDILGICVRSTTLETSAAVQRFAAAQGGAEQATAIGSPTRLAMPLAAFVNGVLAHSLDYDDTHLPSILHPSASVVPAVLSAAEAAGVSGDRVVAAIAVGLEITVRIGMAGYDTHTNQSEYFEQGQHATSMCGAIGSAGAVAAVLGGDATRCAHAMAIACSMASGIIEANRTGGTVKRLHCGWAAQAGVTAAQLALAGITGAPTALEGRFGFFQAMLRDRWNGTAITKDLGSEWCAADIFYKPYPANHFTHAAIDATLRLKAGGLRPEDVVSAHLGVATPTVRTIGEPLGTKQRPETGYQAQFSGPFVIAAALYGGSGLGLGLGDFSDEMATEPLRQALMQRVTVGGDARCDAIYPNQFPAVLTVQTIDGQTLIAEMLVNRGGPQNPLTDEELAAKFRDNVAGLLDPGSATALIQEVSGIAGLANVSTMMRRLG